MGIFRTILALTVVLAHSKSFLGFQSIGGVMAVETFFIISGFYMTLIINEKYAKKNKGYSLFLTNRLLRLLPIYWAILAISTLLSFLMYFLKDNPLLLHQFFKSSLDPFSLFFLIFTNLLILGQDIVLFLGLDIVNKSLVFTSDFSKFDIAAHNFLIIPQAWTISLELLFYLIAPFLVRLKLAILFLIVFTSTLLRFVIYKNGFDFDPWTYRFFPLEIAFFVFGIIAYNLYNKYYPKSINDRKLELIYGMILILILILTLAFQYLPIDYSVKKWFYYLVIMFSVPCIFDFTKKITTDRLIGELSYPIYLSHILIISLSTIIIPQSAISHLYFTPVIIIITIIFSTILVKYIQLPIEKYRRYRIFSYK